MAEITISIDGYPVIPTALSDLMQRMLVLGMEAQLQQKLARVVCPEHGFAPVVALDITRGRQHISITGCCQQLVDLTRQALAVPQV
jgi:hypothetical protein